MSVGETSRKLNERFTEHRSNINTKISGPVAKHLNEICPNMDSLKITPLDLNNIYFTAIYRSIKLFKCILLACAVTTRERRRVAGMGDR